MNKIILVAISIMLLYYFPILVVFLGGFLIACLILSRREEKSVSNNNKDNENKEFETYEDRIKKNLDEVDWPEKSEEDEELIKKWNIELERRRRIEAEKFRRECAGE